ncbi:hypothetical protein [Blastomonas fulva]|nr:hypothetical protein [Blastomonas fulva]
MKCGDGSLIIAASLSLCLLICIAMAAGLTLYGIAKSEAACAQ